MALLHRSTVSLRVMGDSLIPGKMTPLLGTVPSWSCLKGDQIASFPEGRFEIARAGIWSINALDCEPENLDGQVNEILGRLTPDLSIWVDLGERYKLNLFCGLFMRGDNEGILITPQTLISLGQRGIELDCDLYAP